MSFEIIEENNVKIDHRDSFSHYYVPNVKIKDFYVLSDGKVLWLDSKKWRRSLRENYWDE